MKKKSPMKKIDGYFVQIIHSVRVKHDGKIYLRREQIINGIISVHWETNTKNEFGTWDTKDYVTDIKMVNTLNEAYSRMSYLENFK